MKEPVLPPTPDINTVELLKQIERKVLWLSAQIIHHANNERVNVDGLKVGGHQASSASLVTIMTALYFSVLKPEDRVAVKPHASPVFHAIQYLFGNQTLDKLKAFRSFGGAQSYPSRTKDIDDVDFSTGSVGLGVAMTSFASLVQDYIHAKDWQTTWPQGRMVALLGDAELDEGNIYEALLEGWKHELKNCWWIVDYNRQSLDAVISEALFPKLENIFSNFGWEVIAIKYGKHLEKAFQQPGGKALHNWIDSCPNTLFSALTFAGGAIWRKHLIEDLAASPDTLALIGTYDDEALAQLMTNLGGHCMQTCLDAFNSAPTDRPVCFVAYTVKGKGLPFAGHKDNHSGLMNSAQMQELKATHNIADGEEWEAFSGLSHNQEDLRAVIETAPFNARGKRLLSAPQIAIEPIASPAQGATAMSTQEGFGKILSEIARHDTEMAQRIVTTSPDVTVSTNLGGWVNRRAVFAKTPQEDVFQTLKLMSAQRWHSKPSGQHIELGIAENNLFILLAALGLSHKVFGERLLPVGTLYDPFIQRGLDALNYACYQDARFILVATPSGITLAPEGGAHQSISTPLIGMAQDGLATFEPSFVDELAVIMEWAFKYIQREDDDISADDWLRDKSGGSVYLRLSTRSLDQPVRELDEATKRGIIAGGYWLRPPAPGAQLAIAYTGVVAPEAASAIGKLLNHNPGAGLLAITSADRLNAGWKAAQTACQHGQSQTQSYIEELLEPLSRDAGLVTIIDGHPTTLSWLGGVHGHKVQALGVEHFGQTGTIDDLYEAYRIGEDAILEACKIALPQRRIMH